MTKPPELEEKTSFTVDSERTGEQTMPSINRLLNRKKMDLTSATKRMVPPPPPPALTNPHLKSPSAQLGEQNSSNPDSGTQAGTLMVKLHEMEAGAPDSNGALTLDSSQATLERYPSQPFQTQPEPTIPTYSPDLSESSMPPPANFTATIDRPRDSSDNSPLSSPSTGNSPLTSFPNEADFASLDHTMAMPSASKAPPPHDHTQQSAYAPEPPLIPESTFLMSPAEALRTPQDFGMKTELVTPLSTENIPPGIPSTTPLVLLKVQPSTRKQEEPSKKIVIWGKETLRNNVDPLGQGIHKLLQDGARSVLFLSIQPPSEGAKVPYFTSTAAVQPEHKISIWTGLKWNPTIVPEIWNYFIKSGQIELTPPGSMTNQRSNRNVVRAAFGVLQSEWILLVRAGTTQACRGVVAFISEKSLLTALPNALPLLQSEYSANHSK